MNNHNPNPLELATIDDLANEINARCTDTLILIHGAPGQPHNKSKLYSSSIAWQDDAARYLHKDAVRRSTPDDA